MEDIIFSMTQPPEIAEKVERIPAPDGCGEFRTELMGYDTEGAGSLTWREAWKDDETRFWSVDEYHRTSAGQRMQTPVMGSVCFFDAMHSCSLFEHDRKSEGAVVATDLFDDKGIKAQPYWKTVADNSGLPLDSEAIIHPAVDGRILTSGEAYFDDGAYEVAAKTRDVSLLPVPVKKAGTSLVLSGLMNKAGQRSNLPALSAESVLERNLNEASLRQDFKKAVDEAEILKEAVADCIKVDFCGGKFNIPGCEFDGMTKSFNASVMGFGIPVLRSYMGLGDGASLQMYFKARHRMFNKNAESFPACAEVGLLKDFSKSAMTAFHMEHAVLIYRQYKDENQSEKQLKKGFEFIDKAVQAAGLPEADALRVKQDYIEGKLDVKDQKGKPVYQFRDDLNKEYEALKKSLAPVM